MFRKKSFIVACFAVGLFGLLSVSESSAQDYGVRAGVSIDPDQFYFGGHVESEPIYEALRFRPNVEIGVGDGGTIVGLNGEFVWPFELQRNGSVYAGLGPAVNIISANDDTRVEPGLNFVIGYELDEGYFVELKVGALDSPDVKFGFGYTWRP